MNKSLKMSNSLRTQVLSSFKILHRTRQFIFNGDVVALEKGRERINQEYKSKKNVTDQSAIQELVEYSKQVEKELRTTVVQAREVQPGRYELKINKDTVKMDGVPYKQCSSSS